MDESFMNNPLKYRFLHLFRDSRGVIREDRKMECNLTQV